MNKLNASNKQREYWRVLPVAPADVLVQMAQQAEAEGVSGLFAYQVYGPPFIPLAAVAAASRRLKLASGIAVAASRSPFETAMAARDLDTISNGRFILGLGSSIPSVVENIYGVPDVKPLAHLRETVAAIRHIHEHAHQQIPPFNGHYYKAEFSELGPLMPPVTAHLPIWIGALREKMTRLAAEIADGLIGHPMWSRDWALNHIKPALDDELQLRGRKRDELEVNLWLWAAPGENEKQAVDDARETIGFYAGMKAYAPYFESLGFINEVRQLQAGAAVSSAVPDEMVRAFVATGTEDKVREWLEPVWQLADSICVVPPIYKIDPGRQAEYMKHIAEIVSPGK